MIVKKRFYDDRNVISTNYEYFHVVDFDKETTKKYEITSSYIYVGLHKLYRIRATRDIQNPYMIIHKGEVGGYIESEDNLDPYDESWIDKDVHLCENSKVKDLAYLTGNITLFDNSIVCDKVTMFGYGEIQLFGNSNIYQNARLQNKNFESMKINNSSIFGDSDIYGSPFIFNSYIIDSCIQEKSKVLNSNIQDLADIEDDAYINNSNIFGSVVFGNAHIINTNIALGAFGGNASIKSKDDYLYISNFRYNPITFYKDVNNIICVSYCGYNGYLVKFKDTLKFKDEDERDRFDWMVDFVKSYFHNMSRSLVF